MDMIRVIFAAALLLLVVIVARSRWHARQRASDTRSRKLSDLRSRGA
jgi:hypothetical protein